MTLIPIGVSDFEKIRRGDYYFVDKSMFIVDFLRSGAEVTLLPRPRRFGKTLALSMLRCFLEAGKDRRDLFEGLEVSGHDDVMAYLGSVPTVFLTLEDIKFADIDSCNEALSLVLADLYKHHRETIARAEPRDAEASSVDALMKATASPVVMQRALFLLTELLHRATGQKVAVLIDEYDMPIHAGYQNGYYSEIVAFMRNFLSGAFKDNPHLHKGILTGILRVAKVSIFSGFNNPDVCTILDERYANRFGFTEEEVIRALEVFDSGDRIDDVRRWYNGYRFASYTLYNPWSIMQFINDVRYPDSIAKPYWVNTSDNELIRGLITDSHSVPEQDLETLLNGGRIIREVETDIVFSRIDAASVWSLLLFSGYLKSEKTTRENGSITCELSIPNLEVRGFFDKTIRDWIRDQTGPRRLEPLLEALLAEDIKTFRHHLGEVLASVLSYHDTADDRPEKVYHTFFLGMLVNLRGSHRVSSNRESGFGRYDVSLIPHDPTKAAFIFELKTIGSRDGSTVAEDALEQIIDRDYAASAREAGVNRTHLIGIAVEGKRAHIATRLLERDT